MSLNAPARPSHTARSGSAKRFGAAIRLALAVSISAALGESARAEPPAETAGEPKLEAAIPARFVMGVKFGGGGTLWNEPDGTTVGVEENGAEFNIPIFDQTRAGYTMSAGFFLEGIFYEHLGLEVGLHFVQHTLFEQIEWSYTEERITNGVPSVATFEADSEEELSWTAFHMPILVKAVVDAGRSRISLGIGPELSFTSWSRTKFKITKGGLSSTFPDDPNDNTFPKDFPHCFDGKKRLPGTRCGFEKLGARNENSVYLAVVFGIEILAGDFIVPIDLHWSYNFSQPKEYLDRVVLDRDTIPTEGNPDVRPSRLDLRTRESMYGGLRIGLAYPF